MCFLPSEMLGERKISIFASEVIHTLRITATDKWALKWGVIAFPSLSRPIGDLPSVFSFNVIRSLFKDLSGDITLDGIVVGRLKPRVIQYAGKWRGVCHL